MNLIRVASWVTLDEAPVLARALDDRLAQAMLAEGAEVAHGQVADFQEFVAVPPGTIRITSMLPHLADLDLPWPDAEASLRQRLTALAEAGDPVLVLTIFRCVKNRTAPEGQAQLARIRRLNLLAIELSREVGCFVVDIDRVLADRGGLALGGDLRLASEAAASLAGYELALALVTNAMDTCLPFDAQERVRERIEQRRSGFKPATAVWDNDLIALGKGRHRQRVSVNTDAVQESHVGWLLRQFLGGRMGRAEALQRLVMAVRRRGVRECVTLLTSAMARSASRARPA